MHLPLRTIVLAALGVTLAARGVEASRGDDPAATSSPSPFALIEAARAAGEIGESESMLFRFQLAFDPDAVPRAYRPGSQNDTSPLLRCGTPLLIEYREAIDRISVDARRTIEGHLTSKLEDDPTISTLTSPGGNFLLTYATAGEHAVDTTDMDPINGVPDFVERVAGYCDDTWATEVVALGFMAPPLEGQHYEVSFESMGFYGYTKIDSDAPGGSRMVLNSRFAGFPPNDDPDGDRLGAAKATVAHEFKHAIQYVTSGWTEGNWVELDATWVEDLVFDAVNDYYNYLPSGSPISAPAASLDAGGGGSYEDCVWQHYLSETFGPELIVELWQRRAAYLAEPMLDTYDHVLREHGSSLEETWPMFAAWNYATGARTVAGWGYQESSRYPMGPVGDLVGSYPASVAGSVERLAASFVQCSGFSGQRGSLRVDFTRPAASALQLVAVIRQTTGATHIEPLQALGEKSSFVLPVPLETIASLGLIVANGAAEGWGRPWSLDIQEVVRQPEPSLAVDATSLEAAAEKGKSASLHITLSNEGEPGSTLDYEILFMTMLPPPLVGKSVAGSTLEPVTEQYEPGTTAQVTLVVTNNSPDDEWLTGVRATFPAGVTVLASTDFLGGTEGPLVSDGATGTGVTVVWSDQNGGFGNVYGRGEQAEATLTLAFDSALRGDIAIDYVLTGDTWGDAPHSVSGSFLLEPPSDSLDLVQPQGGQFFGIGEAVDIRWASTGTLETVAVEISRDLGSTWETLSTDTPNDGEFAWAAAGPIAASAVFRVRSLDALVESSSSPVTIYEPVTWASATPRQGALAKAESEVVTVTVDATGLSPGRYEATIVVTHGGSGPPTAMPLTLNVQPGPTATPTRARPFGVVSNAPNPFNPSTTITFRLSEAGRARIDIYNAAGQQVKSLVDGRLTAGEHHVPWQGMNDSGQAVASGVYYARLTAGGKSDVLPMVLVR